MARNVWVVADIRQQKLRQVTFDMLGAAQRMAEGGRVTAMLIGHGVAELAAGLGDHGADEVWVADAPQLASFVPRAYLRVLAEAASRQTPDVVLFAHSAVGKSLAPAFAVRIGAGQVSDVTSIDTEDGRLVFTRPIYAGKALTKVVFIRGPMVVTVRPNNLPASTGGAGKPGRIVPLAVPLQPDDLVTLVQEVVQKTRAGADLTEARVIVSGGRGVQSAEGFQPLYELAEVLGGAVGASRGACDAGYCDYALQIGQTGKTVTPDLYIACGISGAIQHIAGMSGSKVIVAINKDPEAPIFQIADYGIVGDLFEVVPRLTQAFRQVLGR
ncbi:electron transfer flavoprotein subunit alpha [Alicyclobacillus cellulosilyticus]|uniref:Electron transfer flavoprotein subunit alpha n=1 Tax=Alicyclobacillus cellulosilyticus TaxID=1003997 RepID=A0A917K3M4_9BACL|nr:electron transfer flavoprotein subunit alpha/FixB family protein [Alicyclobacillus cellulosilyticus]GGI98812.1 electron transfer flavoprotein subunit alpha [Alicyclobacillus cellulosilyticus]